MGSCEFDSAINQRLHLGNVGSFSVIQPDGLRAISIQVPAIFYNRSIQIQYASEILEALYILFVSQGNLWRSSSVFTKGKRIVFHQGFIYNTDDKSIGKGNGCFFSIF